MNQQTHYVLSGLRPTGRVHLGNYFGAIRNWVRLQDSYRCFYFIADWHALTSDYADPENIRQATFEIPTPFLAPNAFALDDSDNPYNALPIDEDLRHELALASCDGCHAPATSTRFQHIAPRFRGQSADLSPFLVRDLTERRVPDLLNHLCDGKSS